MPSCLGRRVGLGALYTCIHFLLRTYRICKANPIQQLKAQGPSRTCNESKEEDEKICKAQAIEHRGRAARWSRDGAAREHLKKIQGLSPEKARPDCLICGELARTLAHATAGWFSLGVMALARARSSAAPEARPAVTGEGIGSV